MAAAHPAALGEALQKLARQDPLTHSERALLQRTLDETPTAAEPFPTHDDPEQIRRLLRLPDGAPLPDAVLEQTVWRAANRDNPDPVLRAFACAPLAEEPMASEARADLDVQMDEIRAGRGRLVPQTEIERMLDERRS